MLKQVPCQVKQLSNTLPTGAACLTWCLPICCSLMKMITGAASAPMTSDLSFNHTGIVNQAAPQTTLHIPQAMVALSGLAHRNACNAIQLLCWSHVMKRTSCVCVCLCVRVCGSVSERARQADGRCTETLRRASQTKRHGNDLRAWAVSLHIHFSWTDEETHGRGEGYEGCRRFP